MPKSKPSTETRNSMFSDDKRAKGLNQGGISSKNPTEAQNSEAHDTAPERASNEQREDVGI